MHMNEGCGGVGYCCRDNPEGRLIALPCLGMARVLAALPIVAAAMSH